MKINYLTDAELNNKIGTCLLTNGIISESAYNHHDYILGGHWLTSSLKDLQEECELKCFKITFTPNNKAIYGAILVSQAVYNGKRQPVTGCLQIRKEDNIEQGVFSNDLSLYYRIDEGCKPLSNIGVAVWCSRNVLVLPDTNTTSSLMSTVYESYPLTVGDDWSGDHVGHYGSVSDDGPHHDYGLRIIPFDYYFHIDGATVDQMNDENNYVIEEMPLPGFFAYDQKAILWKNFSKRLGSTKQPSGKGKEVNVELMDSTSIQHPVFRIDSRDTTWNYMWFRDTYYYINEVIAEYEDYIVVRGDIDRLATFKSYIKASSAYIRRASWGSNNKIKDGLNLPTEEVVMKVSTANKAVVGSSGPYYWIAATSADGYKIYQTNEQGLMDIVHGLWDQNPTVGAPLTLQERQTIIDSIVSIIRVPIACGAGPSENMRFAIFQSTATARPLDLETLDEDEFSLTINFPSSDWGYNSQTYLDTEPYSSAIIYLPFVGVCPLDLSVFASSRTLTIKRYIDKTSADIIYTLNTGGRIISTFSGNIGSKVPISAGGIDETGLKNAISMVVGGAVATLTAPFTGGVTGVAGAGAVAAGINNIERSCEIHTMVGGGLSSSLSYLIDDGYIKVVVFTKKPVSTNITSMSSIKGVPMETVGSLNHNGFVQTADADINMPGTAEDKAAVNAMLDSGIFIE